MPRLPPLSSMWEADSDMDYDADNGNSEGEGPMVQTHEHRCPTCSWRGTCYSEGCGLPILTYCGACSTKLDEGTLPLPAGFRFCATCKVLCKPDPQLDLTKCPWCAWKALKGARS